MDKRLMETLRHVAEFYDARKVGDVGPLGFRRSTDLMTLYNCLDRLVSEGIVRSRQDPVPGPWLCRRPRKCVFQLRGRDFGGR